MFKFGRVYACAGSLGEHFLGTHKQLKILLSLSLSDSQSVIVAPFPTPFSHIYLILSQGSFPFICSEWVLVLYHPPLFFNLEYFFSWSFCYQFPSVASYAS